MAVIAPLAIAASSGADAAEPWSEAAAAAGMIAAAMLFLQLVSSGRFEGLSGRVGIDVTMAFHKWAARVMVAVAVLHPLLFVGPVTLDTAGVALDRLISMLLSPRNLTGVLAILLVVSIVLLALLRDRLPVRYETWRASHGILGLGAVGLSLEHLASVGSYSGAGTLLIFWLTLAFATTVAALGVYTVRAWRMRQQTWRLVAKRRVGTGLWKISIRGRSGDRLAFKAGQFAWLAFAPRRFPLFDHPFSIASGPQRGHLLSFIVRESGDFTSRIGSAGIGTAVGLDGPHGSFTLDDVEADAILLVAGGVGVAPILGILQDLAAKGDRRPVRFVYGARTADAMIDAAEFRPSLDRLNSQALLLVDEPGRGDHPAIGPVTRERLAAAIRDLDPSRIAAMVCGPAPMIGAVADGLRSLGLPLRNIRYERFDYAGDSPSAKDRKVIAGFRVIALSILVAAAAFALR